MKKPIKKIVCYICEGQNFFNCEFCKNPRIEYSDDDERPSSDAESESEYSDDESEYSDYVRPSSDDELINNEQFKLGMNSTETNNPLNKYETCTLISHKKEKFYTHTYDPKPMLKILKDKFRDLNDEKLKIFDQEEKSNCCNVIAISLYFTNNKEDTLKKYLYSIHRSVKNVEKNLKEEWLVRLYLDISVYKNITQISEDNLIFKTYQEIVYSENVEVYTYHCKSFGETIPIAKTRTLRFLPLSDKDVNICIIREADGVVSNLDCHNIKKFSTSNKLFYLPEVSAYKRIYKDDKKRFIPDRESYYTPLFTSYSLWLNLYKHIFETNFFKEHQNLYDLLAGTFGIKLKITRSCYLEKLNKLSDKINNEFVNRVKNNDDRTKLLEELKNRGVLVSNFISYSHPTFSLETFLTDEDYKEVREKILNIGFDEILLLDIFKDIISIKINTENIKESEIQYIAYNLNKKTIQKYESIIFATNIKTVTLPDYYYGTKLNEYLEKVLTLLKEEEKILDPESEFHLLPETDIYIKDTLLYVIDSLLKNNDIICNDVFNIRVTYKGNPSILTELINIPYDRNYDKFYDPRTTGGKFSNLPVPIPRT